MSFGATTYSGLDCVGDVQWGSHFCQFYKSQNDLIDTLVPFFKAGLENNEKCLWVTPEPFKADDARTALRQTLPDLREREAKGQITILNHEEWYLKSGSTDARSVLQGWREREEIALSHGYKGLRLTGNTYWLERQDREGLEDYEAHVTECFTNRRIVGLCSYCLERVHSEGIIDVVRNHEFAVIRRHGNWEVVENAALKTAKAELHKLNDELEQRVVQRTAELEAMVHVRDEFLSVASHELKTPVAALKLFVDGILRAGRAGSLSIEEINSKLVKAEKQCKRIDTLITRLLDFSKATTGSFTINPEPFDYSEITIAIVEQLDDEVQRAGGRLVVSANQPILGVSDSMRFSQIVTNLITNSAKHAPGAMVEVMLQQVKDEVILTVQDNGPGIPEEEQDRIFSRFARGKHGKSTSGFGLGLWVVKQTVESLAGSVKVESEIGSGARFIVRLPINRL